MLLFKKERGLGFNSFRPFNEPLLSNQAWRLMSNPKSLLALGYKARFTQEVMLISKVGHNSSFTWRSIHYAIWVLKKGGFWTVGDGHCINIGQDIWLSYQFVYKLWTVKPSNCEHHTMANLIVNNSWNRELIESTFLPFVAMQNNIFAFHAEALMIK